jgi:carboxyl-terminal processing protease
MLNGEFFPVGDGFQLIVPTADYYTADGIRLDHRGVEPDIKAKPDKALDAALERAKP